MARATPPLRSSSPSHGPHSVAVENTTPRHPNNVSKADALLRSVINSISSPSSTPPPAPNAASNRTTPVPDGSGPSTPPPAASISAAPGGGIAVSAAERKKALTDALFGSLGSIKADSESRAGLTRSPSQQAAASPVPPVSQPPPPSSSQNATTEPSQFRSHSSLSPSPSPSPPLTGPEPSTRSLSRVATEKLHQDVQRQAAAATAALKSPSAITVSEELPKRKSTKKIKTSRISSPYLVSSTTSVDATPITSPSMISLPSNSPNASLSKFSLKRLRTTLRSKQNAPTGDEITPWIDPSTPPASQSVQYPQHVPSPTSRLLARQPGSANSFSRDEIAPDFRFPASSASNGSVQLPTSPPASAPTVPRSAGLRGFMSRIRRAPRREDDIGSSELDVPRKPAELSRNRSVAAASLSGHISTDTDGRPAVSGPAPPARSQSVRLPPKTVFGSPPPDSTIQQSQVSSSPVPVSAPPGDEAALRQFYDAAEKLGYPHAALDEFLSRSGSVTSNYRNTESLRSARSPTPAADVAAGLSSEAYLRSPPTSSTDNSPVQMAGSTPTSHGAPDAINSSNAVVRRTLYIASDTTPSEAMDDNIPPPRRSSIRHSHKRSASITSMQSGRSVLDRAPTPPPNKSARRKSQEPSPPVPRLPSFASQGSRLSPTIPTRTRAPLSG